LPYLSSQRTQKSIAIILRKSYATIANRNAKNNESHSVFRWL